MITRFLRRRGGGAETRYPPAPFVVGVPRSGTTLLRLMLDAHPEVAIPFETRFVPDLISAASERRASPDRLAEIVTTHHKWGDFHLDAEELRERFRALRRPTPGDFVRAFYALYAERQAKPRWGDKTPGYIKHMRTIEKTLPEARFIHLIRDGRDVALSVLQMDWGADSVAKAAKSWKNRIEEARSEAPGLKHYLEVRYEDLVLDTEPTLRRVCEFCELSWDSRMLAYHERAAERLQEKARDMLRPGRPPRPAALRLASHALTKEPPRVDRIGRWRAEMSAADRAAYEGIAGDLLAQLGYEVGTGRSPAGRS